MNFLKKSINFFIITSILFLTPLSFSLIRHNETQEKAVLSSLRQQQSERGDISPLGSEITLSLNANIAYAGYFTCDGNFDIPCGFNNILFSVLISFGNTLVGLSATFMDFFLSHSIASTSYTSSPFIKQGWEILRDLTNIIFIFALLVIAFNFVLGSGGTKAKGKIIKILLITLTINFSLFASLFVIDVSNILAHIFYNRIKTEKVTLNRVSEDTSGIESISGSSLSLQIANNVNPQKIFDNSGMGNIGAKDNGKRLAMVLIGGMINIALIFIFITLSLYFLGRTVGLWISSVLSALAFASLTIPGMENIEYIGFNRWFRSHLKMAFMAPVFLFLLYLSVIFMNIKITTNFSTNSSFLDNLLAIIIPMIAIFVVITTSKKVAMSMTGDFAGVVADYALKGIAGLAITGASIASGGLAAAAGGFGGAMLGAGKMFGSEKLQKAGKRLTRVKSFDVRKIPGFSKAASITGFGGAFSKFAGAMGNKSALGTVRKGNLMQKKLRLAAGDLMRGKSGQEADLEFEKKNAELQKELDRRRTTGVASWEATVRKERANVFADQVASDVANKISKNPKVIVAKTERDLAEKAMQANPLAVEKEEKALKALTSELGDFKTQLASAKGAGNTALAGDLEKKVAAQQLRIDARKHGKEVSISKAESLVDKMMKSKSKSAKEAAQHILEKDEKGKESIYSVYASKDVDAFKSTFERKKKKLRNEKYTVLKDEIASEADVKRKNAMLSRTGKIIQESDKKDT